MKLAIMQPYIFPYIGYFQLIYSVHKFVIYDDVSYIKQGWINRNRILLNGQPRYFTISLSGASSFKKIMEIEFKIDSKKLLKTIYHAYKKAPFFSEVYPMIENIITHKETNLARFVTNSLMRVTKYLEISTEFIISSDKQIATELKGKERVIAICNYLNATHYYNAMGGKGLYAKDEFKKNGIELKFIKTKEIIYKQFDNNFVPFLSIIDSMMFNPVEAIQEMLKEYELI